MISVTMLPEHKLSLSSLKIEQFKSFAHLSVEKVGAVNLIVGKNSVGKTCLLEALRLYFNGGNPQTLRQILEDREQVDFSKLERVINETEEEEYIYSMLLTLFHHGSRAAIPSPIRIGEIVSNEGLLSISLEWFLEERDSTGRRTLEKIDFRDSPEESEVVIDEIENLLGAVKGLSIQRNGSRVHSYRLNRVLSKSQSIRKGTSTFIPSQGLSSREISKFWDSVTLTPLEDDVLMALRIIVPEIIGVNIINRPIPSYESVAIARLGNLVEPTPLSTLGDGLNRLFGIALALVNTQNGVLIIDEIESGLHYSVQLKLWELIFQVAKQLNVQVFATTHSWDCVEAFQEAAANSPDEGVLIRLERRGEKIVSTVFDEEDLAFVTRDQIEIR